MAKPRKPKTVHYTLLPTENYREMYKLLARLIEAHHSELREAEIALAWCTAWKPDVDGHQKLGQCKRASDLDRELARYDFVILLARDFWTNPEVSDEQRSALLDHELCHATVALDRKTHEPLEDARGRKIYRLRRHDLEEFAEIAERYGCWKRDLTTFARALRRNANQAELPLEEAPRSAAVRTH